MAQVKTVKVGKLPGRIEEFAVETGKTISELLTLAGQDPAGHDVKVDGVLVANPSATTVTDSTNMVLLVQKVKGNR